MFKFLKERLSRTVSKISEAIKSEDKEEPKKGVFKKVKEKVTHKTLSEDKFDQLFYELELSLLENNIAYEIIGKIKDDLKQEIINRSIKRTQISQKIKESLKNSISSLFKEPENLIEKIKHKSEKPFVIVFFGVNGVGKTSTIAKLANLLQKNNLTVVLGAGDSFRKAAIEQLEELSKQLNVKVIKHDYGADPAAVCFDTISYAKKNKIDVVLLDTAGRQHSNINLMDELKKIIKVTKPDEKIFVGESITGNDCIDQSKLFNEAINFDSIILTKIDVDEKGGAAISISYITQKPIIFLTKGQSLNDIEKFDKEKIIKTLFK